MWHSTVSRWAAGAGSSCQDKLVTSYNTTTPSTLQWPPPTQWTNNTTPLLLCCGGYITRMEERGTVGGMVGVTSAGAYLQFSFQCLDVQYVNHVRDDKI